MDAFPRFLDAAAPADLRIGVVSSDTTNIYEREGMQRFTYMDEFPWMLTDFTVAECGDTRLERGCARRIIDPSAVSRDEAIDAFRDGVLSLGNCGSGNQQPLHAAISAIDHQRDCNRDLFRDDAMLLVVVVTDEQEASNAAVEEVLASFVIRKPGALRMGGILGAVDGVASDCGIGLGATCGSVCDADIPPGSETPCMMDSQCSDGEACISGACDNPMLRYWNSCFACSFYRAPDCCAAVASNKAVDVIRAFESVSGHAVAIESICDPDLGDAMAKMADLLRTE